MEKQNKYKWNYVTVGGVTRVNIATGEDIAHLAELDRKQWTVLSCPVKGLEFDERTLQLMDTNGDGRIHVDEVIAASQWLTTALKSDDILLKGTDTLKLSELNQDTDEGKSLYNSARQILVNLGKADADAISVADTADSVAIFAKTQFNGDGIVTPASTDDEALKAVIGHIIATVGSATDRSGEAGINADHVEAFYTALADYAAWQSAAEADKANVFPYGADTEAALAAVDAMKDKIADYFMRCKLTAFASEASATLDVTAAQIEAVSAGNLAAADTEIASFPLSHVNADGVLLFKGINPAWQGAFAALKSVVLDKEFADADGITEAQWQAVTARFAAYTAWKGAKKGEAVEPLGADVVAALLKADNKAALLDLIAQDKALEAEAAAIDSVDKLTHLCRDFGTLLRNYVSMSDFYNSWQSDVKAIFQSGRLFIEGRSTDLCIRVEDMGKHGGMAALSGMYIVYCNCVSKVKPAPLTVAAVLTDGDVANIRPGTNAIFYDRDGLDWDATVTSIVDNPISVRQAFWRPYRKLGNWISDKIDKTAADKENTSTTGLLSKAENTTIPTTEGEAAAVKADAKKTSFDIAKFAGIFAAIGLAVGALGAALAALGKAIVSAWYVLPLIIVGIIVLVSGPSMFIAWRKLRRRDLAPVLNANGWAINSRILVNTRFGATLTNLAKYPKVVGKDPFVKRTPAWLKWLRGILLVLVCAFAVLFFTDNLKCIGLPFHKEKPATEVVEAPAAEAAAEVPAEEAPVEEAPAE